MLEWSAVQSCERPQPAVFYSLAGKLLQIRDTRFLVSERQLSREPDKGYDVVKIAQVPTYDLSCAAGIDGGCPFGSVHQPHKVEVGRRVGLHLGKMLLPPPPIPASRRAVQGPTATQIHVVPGSLDTAVTPGRNNFAEQMLSTFVVSVSFEGGSAPFALRPTRNCTSCCDGSHTVDFDASIDGRGGWTNGTSVTLDVHARTLSFKVVLTASPKVVRHTAAAVFPQCALYNAEGLPLLPFAMDISPSPSP